MKLFAVTLTFQSAHLAGWKTGATKLNRVLAPMLVQSWKSKLRMKPGRNKNAALLGPCNCLSFLRQTISFVAALFGYALVMFLATAMQAAPVGETQLPVLEFIEPTNNAVFSTLDEIPIVLRASAPNDVILAADVFANQQKIASVSFCCWLCPCARPVEGQETILQIPVPWQEGTPAQRTWQGWTNVHAGSYRLTARAVGENGTIVQAAPVTITVLDLTLRIFVQPDGTMRLVIPEGSLVEGGYDLEASQDLRAWTRLGAFEPGNVAAFYSDLPPESARQRRFYRSVHVLPRVP
jgi:hypothetical protein